MDEILLVADTELLLQDDSELLIETLPGDAELVEAATQGPPGPPGSALAQATAAAPLNGHRAVTYTDTGRVRHADCIQAGDTHIAGITLGAALTGDTVDLRLSGPLEHLGWTFAPGQPIYLGADGALVQTLPPGAVFVKPLGTALSATRIQLDPQPAIYL